MFSTEVNACQLLLIVEELCRHCATNTLVTQRARCVKKKVGLFTNVLAKKYPIVRAVESFDLESSTSNLKKWQSIIWLDEQSKPNYIKFIQPFFKVLLYQGEPFVFPFVLLSVLIPVTKVT